MKLLTSVNRYIEACGLIEHGDRIVVGVSGGADSICLLHLLVQLKQALLLDIIVAHFNHQWRPDSDVDQQFVKEVANGHGLEFVHARLDSIDTEVKYDGSHEAYARKIRRSFFEHVASKVNANSIVLGHTADDQEETFFIRLIRGASIAGLGAIRPQSGLYVRPLLETRRRDIEAYLKEHVLEFRHDATNESDDFLRNRIRKYVLPALQEADSRFEKNFHSMLNHLGETHEFVQGIVDVFVREITVEKEGVWWLNCDRFLNVDSYLHVPILLEICILACMEFTPTKGMFNEIVRFIRNTKSREHKLGSAGTLLKKMFADSNGKKTHFLGFYSDQNTAQQDTQQTQRSA